MRSQPIYLWHSVSGYFVKLFAIVIAFAGCVASPGCNEKEKPIYQIGGIAPSPSGDRAAFFAIRGNPEKDENLDIRLWIVSIDDGVAMDTRAEILNSVQPLSWSPDGTSIAFVSGSAAGLNVIELKTLKVSQLAEGWCIWPRYSPDGKYIGYIRDGDLTLLDTSSGQSRVVAEGAIWCWNADASTIFYVREGKIYQWFLEEEVKDRLFYDLGPGGEQIPPSHLLCSPDGKRLGFFWDGYFQVLALGQTEPEKVFECDHYFLDFDWGRSGICYLDKVNGERKNKARLMVYDFESGEPKEIASGGFAFPSWITHDEILVRRGSAELWIYSTSTGQGRMVFGPNSH